MRDGGDDEADGLGLLRPAEQEYQADQGQARGLA
jgi:hypothetical protein